MATTKSFTASLLRAHGFRDATALFTQLNKLSDQQLRDRGIRSKGLLEADFRRLLLSLELDGEMVRETAEMTKAGNLLESMRDHHLLIRRAYLKKRTRLKEKLHQVFG